jgi:predicted small lipoprotein YifL
MMMKRLISNLAVLIAAAVVLTACAGNGPSDVVKKYLNAAQKGDINEMMDCIEPDAAALLKGAADIAGDQFGIDSEAVMNMAPGMMSLYNENGELFGIDYEITDEQIEDDQATVTANITYTVEEESQSQEMDIPLEKIEGRWYISMN